MIRFKQFLNERLEQDDNWVPSAPRQTTTSTKVPLRGDFPEGEQGQQQYLQALKAAAPKLKQEAETFSQNAKDSENILANVETGLKAAETVADVALSVGSITPPGAMINAGVKLAKGGMAAGEGDYVKATANVLDAAAPGVGKIASGLGAGTKMASNIAGAIADPAAGIAKGAMGLIGKATSSASSMGARAAEAGARSMAQKGLKAGIDAAVEDSERLRAEREALSQRNATTT